MMTHDTHKFFVSYTKNIAALAASAYPDPKGSNYCFS